MAGVWEGSAFERSDSVRLEGEGAIGGAPKFSVSSAAGRVNVHSKLP